MFETVVKHKFPVGAKIKPKRVTIETFTVMSVISDADKAVAYHLSSFNNVSGDFRTHTVSEDVIVDWEIVETENRR